MLRTYSEVMSRVPYLQALKMIPYTGYSAILYRRLLPLATLIPILAAIGIILSFLLPWFSLENPVITLGNVSIRTYTGFEIASSGATLFNDTFSFPLWLLVFLGTALIVLSLFLLGSKVLTFELSLSIKLVFGTALLVEIGYLFTSLFGSFSIIRSHLPSNHSLPVNVGYGLWICMLITVIAGGACLFLFSELSWCWLLAQDDIEQVARRTNFKPIFPERKL